MSSTMGFNADEAVLAFNNALAENDELTDAMDKASKKVSDAFGATANVITGNLGALMSKVWGDGSESFFKNTLIKQTELFLLYKVKAIIYNQHIFAVDTDSIYKSVNKEETH